MLLNKFSFRAFMTAVATAVLSCTASAQGVLAVKDVSLGLAQAIAQGVIDQCRKDGFRVTVTVMNQPGRLSSFCGTMVRPRTRWIQADAKPTPL